MLFLLLNQAFQNMNEKASLKESTQPCFTSFLEHFLLVISKAVFNNEILDLSQITAYDMVLHGKT